MRARRRVGARSTAVATGVAAVQALGGVLAGPAGAGVPVDGATGQAAVVGAPRVAASQVGPLEPPTITAPAIHVGTDPNTCSASVEYGDLVVTGDPVPAVSVSPPSGSVFEVGTTTVQVIAENSAGSTSADFTVTVTDIQPPLIRFVGGVFTVDATDPSGAFVGEPPFTAVDNCGDVTISTDAPSSGTYPVGFTVVTGTATDRAGNTSSATLAVHVRGAEDQLLTLSERATGLGLGASLQVRLDRAREELAAGRPRGACRAMASFVSAVTVQTPRHIDPLDSQTLIGGASRIRAVLGCASRGEPGPTGPG